MIALRDIKGFSFMLCLFVCVAVAGFAGNVFAAIDLSDFSISLVTVEILVPIILIGLAEMWVVRKLVKTTNRS